MLGAVGGTWWWGTGDKDAVVRGGGWSRFHGAIQWFGCEKARASGVNWLRCGERSRPFGRALGRRSLHQVLKHWGRSDHSIVLLTGEH